MEDRSNRPYKMSDDIEKLEEILKTLNTLMRRYKKEKQKYIASLVNIAVKTLDMLIETLKEKNEQTHN